jgi:hypothetical protein
LEWLLEIEGTSIDFRTSGPGSPISSDWKLSSVTDDGAVEMMFASYETGDRGDGKEDDWVTDE